MQKIALITRSGGSTWRSCQSITKNLIESYGLLEDFIVRQFEYNEGMSNLSARRAVREVLKFNPQIISFVDHQPHPESFISFLREENLKIPSCIVVHVFGDFILGACQWARLNQKIIGLPIKFICASTKQKNLIASLMENQSMQMFTVPFPVNQRLFTFEEQARIDFRKKEACLENEEIFLYSGRLSVQKNIISLISSFASYHNLINSKAKLWLAGPVDDIGVPYLGKKSPYGLYSRDIAHQLDLLFPSEVDRPVKYFGNLSMALLNSIYCASDCYISLSTHNDEDFGMGPAEAALTGLPLILTDWGGYSAFETHLPNSCLTVPVKLMKREVSCSPQSAVKAMMNFSSQKRINNNRNLDSIKANEIFSIPAASLKIHQVLKAPAVGFPGFNSKFFKVANSFRLNPRAPFSDGLDFCLLYREVYGAYV